MFWQGLRIFNSTIVRIIKLQFSAFGRNLRSISNRLLNRKQKAHKIYKKDNNSENLQNYQEICRQLDAANKIAHEEHNRKVEHQIKSCPKNFFNYVKIKLKNSDFPSRMHLDSKLGQTNN